jgi:hypothetical protein
MENPKCEKKFNYAACFITPIWSIRFGQYAILLMWLEVLAITIVLSGISNEWLRYVSGVPLLAYGVAIGFFSNRMCWSSQIENAVEKGLAQPDADKFDRQQNTWNRIGIVLFVIIIALWVLFM